MKSKTQIHHFIPGLRFHSFWYYQARGATGRVRWARLPMVSDARSQADPHGAWWCAQRCAAVLAQRPWRSMPLPSGLPAQPGAEEVAREMQQWLPDWRAATASVERCTHVLQRGGSALLQLHAWNRATPAPRWAWVVGVEWEASLPRQARPMQPRALLIVPFGQDLPWATGHTARMRLHGQGQGQGQGQEEMQDLHEVVAHSGYWFHDSGLPAVVLEPAAALRTGRAA